MGPDPSDLDVLETPEGAVRVSDEGDGVKWKPAQRVDDDDINHHLHHLQPTKNNQRQQHKHTQLTAADGIIIFK